jgi:hypothetical protein
MGDRRATPAAGDPGPLRVAALLLTVAACTAPNPAYWPATFDDSDAAPLADAAPAADQVPTDGSLEAAAPPDLTSHLIGYWKLDEAPGATSVTDASGMGHHGILENLDAGTVWVAGRRGGALEITGENRASGVRVPLTPVIAALQRFTVAAWAHRDSLDQDYASIISRQLGQSQWEVFNLSFTQALLSIYLPSGTPVSAYPFVVRTRRSTPAARWIHVAATFDGKMLRVFLDGVEEGSVSYPRPIPATDTPLYLGTNQNDRDGEPMVGRLDDILLYTEALPPPAIAALAAGALPAGR